MAIPQGFSYAPVGGAGGRPFGSMGGNQDVYAQFLNSLNMPPAHSGGPVIAPPSGTPSMIGSKVGGAGNTGSSASMNWAQLMPYLQKMFSGGIGNVNWAQLLPMLMQQFSGGQGQGQSGGTPRFLGLPIQARPLMG